MGEDILFFQYKIPSPSLLVRMDLFISYDFLCLIEVILFSAIVFSSDSNLGPGDCSGYLRIGANRICGNFDNDAARRACWERGLNLDTGTGRRQYR